MNIKTIIATLLLSFSFTFYYSVDSHVDVVTLV